MAIGEIGWLQHRAGPEGPFQTEEVPVRHQYADRWQARFEGRWRRVYVTDKGLYILYQGKRIVLQIDGNPL